MYRLLARITQYQGHGVLPCRCLMEGPMQEERDDNEQALTDAVSCAREFVLQQLQAGKRADALSFALAFIATELGLHVTQGRDPLGVMRTWLHGVLAAADAFLVGRQQEASSDAGAALRHEIDAVPKGMALH